ncbi:hypothetical protein BaRGS_00014688 [Batillaria attramentaria]|uniref:Uncharacterized protein n=1 Tax=Batillaria attramentaria TaxID=370345 RepID=A0ABD0L3H5_9CAEN
MEAVSTEDKTASKVWHMEVKTLQAQFAEAFVWKDVAGARVRKWCNEKDKERRSCRLRQEEFMMREGLFATAMKENKFSSPEEKELF